MPTIVLPPAVANGTVSDPNAQWNTMRTALSRLPRGIMAADNQLAAAAGAMAAAIGAAETSTNLVSPATATEAVRWYGIEFLFEMRNGQALTSYATARVRRGTTTAGTLILGPVGISDRSGTASRDLVRVFALDQPGAQAAQQWVLTLQADAGTIDVWKPYAVIVHDMGAV